MPTSSDDSGSPPAIDLRGVTKHFRVGLRAHRSVGDGLRRVGRFLTGKGPLRRQTLTALDDVSARMAVGESVGVIGANGSGKTTLLKLIAGISRPSAGEIRVPGRVAALIEVVAGFHPELSGRENTYMTGTVLGLRRREVVERLDEIVEFAGIGDMIDTPVKRYSAGMNARLGFAVAAHVDPDVLLVDEVLSVGDFAFQQRCIARMRALRDSGMTIVFVSHNLASVRGLCRRTILLHEGRIVADGETGPVISAYHRLLSEVRHVLGPWGEVQPVSGDSGVSGSAEIDSVEISADGKGAGGVFRSGAEVRVRVRARALERLSDPQVVLAVSAASGQLAYQFISRGVGAGTGDFEAGGGFTIHLRMTLHLAMGNYAVGVGILEPGCTELRAWSPSAASFFVDGRAGSTGVAELGAELIAVVEE